MIIEAEQEVLSPSNNTIVGDPLCEDTQIIFQGKNNILFAEAGVRITGSRIVFAGDSAVLYLSRSHRVYRLTMDIYRETSVYIGSGNYFGSCLSAVISERQNLIIGSGCMFSFGIWIRTADPHLIYDADSHQRTNQSRSVFIGDHVWVGQNALLLKGTRIGSGSILSAAAVAAGKQIGSNCIYAGNPARRIRDNIFWEGSCVHNYTREKTKASLRYSRDDFLYADLSPLDMTAVGKELTEAPDAEIRLSLLQKLAASGSEKNRFYLAPEPAPTFWQRLHRR